MLPLLFAQMSLTVMLLSLPIQAIVMKDRETGRSRGFGFITFSAQGEAEAAITGLNEQDLDGRTIKVNLANARPTGGGGGGGGGYSGGGGYGGGGYGGKSHPSTHPVGRYPVH